MRPGMAQTIVGRIPDRKVYTLAGKNKSANIREENTGTPIRTKKFYFTDGAQVKVPAPTIPGVVPMSKQKNPPAGGNTAKTGSGMAEKQGTGKKKKKNNANPTAEAAVPVTEKKPEKKSEKTAEAKPGKKAEQKSGKAGQKKAGKAKPNAVPAESDMPKQKRNAGKENTPKSGKDTVQNTVSEGSGKRKQGKAKKIAARENSVEGKTEAVREQPTKSAKASPMKQNKGKAEAVQDNSPKVKKDAGRETQSQSAKASRHKNTPQKDLASVKPHKSKKESPETAVSVREEKPATGEQDTTMHRRKQKSGRRSAEYTRQNKQNRRHHATHLEEDALIECRFSYSGSGYGFGERLDGDEEDIFIAPRATMDAMTGDTVQVRITGSSRRGGQSAEGEVVAITEHNVTAIIGTLRLTDDGVFYVQPNNEKLRTPVYIPAKDVATLDIGTNTKVEVIPDGQQYFVRSKHIAVQRRASSGKRGKKGHRPERREDTPFFELAGRISTVFGDADSKEANYAAILHESGIRTEFPAYVIKAAENASAEILTSDSRRDIRDKIIFTIDGAGAKDLDDAISLEKTDSGYILGVHIADVSHYAPFGSCIENEARLRGTSVYFTDKVVPMLPKALSNHACSLNAESDKYALSCEITLDKEGNRTHTVVYKSRMQSAVRGVYEEVNDLFDKGEASEFYGKYRAVADVLADMKDLYRILAARSEARGVMELESPEPEILLDETGFPVAIVPRVRGDAEKMIEQFMLQANMAVGELLNGLGLPCLYRIHDEPNGEKIKNFAVFAHNLGLSTYDLADYGASDKEKKGLSDKLSAVLTQAKEKGIGEIVSSVLLRSMMKAKYVSVCSPHFGLGVPVYCHFTSPIRRYPDLFVHNVLSAVLPYAPNGVLTTDTKLPPEAFPKQLDAECAACGISSTETEIQAQNAEWKIEDLYMALYMSAHVGEMFDVTVDSVIRQGIFVRCDNLAEGMLPASAIPDARLDPERMSFRWNGETYGLGARMRLQLTEADTASGRITFGIGE